MTDYNWANILYNGDIKARVGYRELMGAIDMVFNKYWFYYMKLHKKRIFLLECLNTSSFDKFCTYHILHRQAPEEVDIRLVLKIIKFFYSVV